MSRSTQEILARRRFSESLDTVLPSEVLEELRRRYGPGRPVPPPKQPPPLPPSRQQQQPLPVDRSREYSRLILGGLGLVAVLAGLACLIGGLKHESATVPAPAPLAPFGGTVVQAPAIPTTPASQKPVGEPLATPQPVIQPSIPASVPVPSVAVPAPAPEVRRAEPVTRRAELVKLPPPRAKLMSIPLGSWVRLSMPDGSQEWALFRGVIPSAAVLPQAGAPGDLYIASDTGAAWVWVPSANNGAGGWVDP